MDLDRRRMGAIGLYQVHDLTSRRNVDTCINCWREKLFITGFFLQNSSESDYRLCYFFYEFSCAQLRCDFSSKKICRTIPLQLKQLRSIQGWHTTPCVLPLHNAHLSLRVSFIVFISRRRCFCFQAE